MRVITLTVAAVLVAFLGSNIVTAEISPPAFPERASPGTYPTAPNPENMVIETSEVWFEGNTDTGVGTAYATISVWPFSYNVFYEHDGQSSVFWHPADGVTVVLGTGDDDELENETNESYWFFGFGGNDTITGGPERDCISCGPGDDIAYGEDGEDLILGGDGDDTLHGGDDDDHIYGEGDDDTLLNGDEGNDWLVCGAGDGEQKAFGGNGGDQIWGGPGADLLSGETEDNPTSPDTGSTGGVDYIYTVGGGDSVFGGPLGDYIFVAEADDAVSVYGGGGADTIKLWKNMGDIFGDYANPALATNAGQDKIYLYDGAGTAVFDYTIKCGPEQDWVYYGGPHPDKIHGDAGDDWLDGGEGNDQVWGEGGVDNIYGGLGTNSDILYGDGDQDYIWGGLGNDNIIGGAGDDFLYGDMGVGASAGSLETGDTEGDDNIYCNAGADTAYGNGGADKIHGGADGDSIYGNDGNDKLAGGGDGDTIEGGAGDDYIWGDAGTDTLRGQAGSDRIDGGEGADQLFGGADNDFVIDRSSEVDTLWGGDQGGPGDGDDLLDCWNGASPWDVLDGEGGTGDLIYCDDGDTHDTDDFNENTTTPVYNANSSEDPANWTGKPNENFGD